MKRATQKLIRDYAFTISIAIGVAFFIRSFVIEAYSVPSLAMKPTLISGDTLFVAKWPFRIQKQYQPNYGDIIVFTSSAGPNSDPLNFIKRVVGLPGDQIEIRKGFLYLNGKILVSAQTVLDPCPTEHFPNGKSVQICFSPPTFETKGPEKVPPQSVFVIGDLRGELKASPTEKVEKKSRKGWGIIPLDSIKGKALWIWLSVEGTSKNSILPLPHLRWERMFRRIE